MSRQKQGPLGLIYAYVVRYRDGSPGPARVRAWRTYAYDAEHAAELFAAAASPEWVPLGVHRA